MESCQSSNINDGAHRLGISHEEMIQYYTDWARKGTYEQVSRGQSETYPDRSIILILLDLMPQRSKGVYLQIVE